MDPMKPPQIPVYTASPPKKAKKSKNTDSVVADIVENDSVFVSRLLGPLDGNIDESPLTPAPVYSSGTYYRAILSPSHEFELLRF